MEVENKRLHSVFEIVGSYVVDLYYNHFNRESNRFVAQNKAETKVEAYKQIVTIFITSLRNKAAYNKVIHGILERYKGLTKFHRLQYIEFVPHILMNFIPIKFLKQMKYEHKVLKLQEIIINSLKEMGRVVVSPNVTSMITSNSVNKNLIRKLQDKYIKILMGERERIFNVIFMKKIKHSPDQNNGLSKLKEVIYKLIKEKIVLEKNNKELADVSQALINKVKETQAKMTIQEREIRQLQEQVAELKSRPPPQQITHVMHPGQSGKYLQHTPSNTMQASQVSQPQIAFSKPRVTFSDPISTFNKSQDYSYEDNKENTSVVTPMNETSSYSNMNPPYNYDTKSSYVEEASDDECEEDGMDSIEGVNSRDEEDTLESMIISNDDTSEAQKCENPMGFEENKGFASNIQLD